MAAAQTILLDGPLGTELAVRGVPTPPPQWSGEAINTAPRVIEAIHRDYALAGATVHTAATFRTHARQAGPGWEALTARAVALTRGAIPRHHLVAGSIAPLEDCYRPDLSPLDSRPEHRAIARALARSGVDLLLCETFPHVGEALVAVEEAVATGLLVWASFTAGHRADLLTPIEVGHAARAAVARGASAVLVNCIPATRTLPYVEQLATAGVPFGAYANAGAPEEALGWDTAREPVACARAARVYAELASTWRAVGATLLGGCCGTGPAHIAALAASITPPSAPRFPSEAG
ncbi:homocysteine S-methyltransferase [Chondromyces crocatus]|uniref:Homocysteine S-methyltransferase n=2 Tax=Chondromyces crocatus TaxID=52 RepID=A0A0K1E8V6_CHOCO|nr:homocysteine S-methyltransferase [Chondromyces crocatus]